MNYLGIPHEQEEERGKERREKGREKEIILKMRNYAAMLLTIIIFSYIPYFSLSVLCGECIFQYFTVFDN